MFTDPSRNEPKDVQMPLIVETVEKQMETIVNTYPVEGSRDEIQ